MKTRRIRKSINSPLLFCTVLLLPFTLLSGCDYSNNTIGEGRVNEPNQEPDPVVVDQPITYIERTLPRDDMGMAEMDDVLEPDAFFPGAKLVIKARSKSDAPEIVVTDGIFPDEPEDPDMENSPLVPARYDVKDLDVSPDGSKLLFAMRAPEIPNADDDEQPTWNIWQYDRLNEKLERLMISDILAEGGQDVSPRYLPDGRIVFSSNRQRRTRAILLDEGKPQYSGQTEDRQRDAFLLHVLDPGLQEIEQITYNASHDLQPSVLPDGRILFLRWDRVANNNRLSLYTINQDGTNLSLEYGYDSQSTGPNDTEGVSFRTTPMPDGRVITILRPRESNRFGGDIVAIDTTNFTEIDLEVPSSVSSELTAQESLSPGEVLTDDNISPLGYFNSAYPLYDNTNRFLVSWSQCRLVDASMETTSPCTERFLEQEQLREADSDFGLWILDLDAGTQLPVITPNSGTMYTEAKILSVLDSPERRVATLDEDLLNQGVGSIHIRSVYDIDGVDTQGIAATADPAQTPADQRPVRFLRLYKHVPLPDQDTRDFRNSAFGLGNRNYMRDIIGYVPVEPDGSVKFKVPADMAFGFEVIDGQGKSLAGRNHNNWLSVRAGEQRECNGCHTSDSRVAHGRADAEPESANPGSIGDMKFANSVLLDENGIEHITPDATETMAQYWSRVNNTIREPSIDLLFTDDWTDESAGLSKAADIVGSYANIQTTRDPNCDAPAVAPRVFIPPSLCRSVKSAANNVDRMWDPLCRITLNYLDSIQPIWEKDRRDCDDMGELVEDRTCASCHSRTNADGENQLPGGNLELTGEISQENMEYVTSYVDLTNQDSKQHLINNSYVDFAIEDPNLVLMLGPDGEILNMPSGKFLRDPVTGELVLDGMGRAIPLYNPQTVTTAQTLNTGPARNNDYFFNMFETGYNDEMHTVNHKDFLSFDELKLIAEWLDVGAQYYNNPFDAPVN